MPDIHFHDIYADFSDESFKGIYSDTTKRYATIRSMQAQLNSTRLFNENYFALIAALDDAASRNIRIIAIPGDFSDDGQPIHLRGFKKIIDHYKETYGMQFFITPGNHDPVKPYDSPGGKRDYLSTQGENQAILSRGLAECENYTGEKALIKTNQSLPSICSEEVKHLGYQSIMSLLDDYGFAPKKEFIYWESPYYLSKTYSYLDTLKNASFEQRQYEICHQGVGGKHKPRSYSDCKLVPDASYLVEPIEGLWLLAIDANVYIPQQGGGDDLSKFEGSGNAGYNKMLTHKSHVIKWIEDVVKRAEAQQKTLVAFSHFPMGEFYDEQSDALGNLFGQTSFQLQRKPKEHTSQALANTGLKLHIGGHMHFNDTAIVKGNDGKSLLNIQAPSLAAYIPAYKIVEIDKNQTAKVTSVVLKDVPRFNELFEHYAVEHENLVKNNAVNIWSKSILNAKNYQEFTEGHLRELVKQRFFPQEWPSSLKDSLFHLTGEDLITMAFFSGTVNPEQLPKTPEWLAAQKNASNYASSHHANLQEFQKWSGFDLAVDFYRIVNAGYLGLTDIDQSRREQYTLLANALSKNTSNGFTTDLNQLLSIMVKMIEEETTDTMTVDLK